MAEHTFAGLACADVADLGAAFALGALEPAESDAVRRHLAECPETHAEVAELRSVVPALFEIPERVAPPAALKDRILAAARAEAEAASSTASPAAPRATLAARSHTTERRDAENRAPGWASIFRRPLWAPVAIAAALALVALAFWNVQLQRDNEVLTAYRNGVVEVLEQAAAPGAQLAVLAPSAGGTGPSGLAAVAADGRVAIVMRDLTPTTGTEVYEAWLIAGQDAPIPVGEFKVASGGLGTFETVHHAAGQGVVVALTLEPGPDSTVPTLPIIAAGQAKSQAT